MNDLIDAKIHLAITGTILKAGDGEVTGPLRNTDKLAWLTSSFHSLTIPLVLYGKWWDSSYSESDTLTNTVIVALLLRGNRWHICNGNPNNGTGREFPQTATGVLDLADRYQVLPNGENVGRNSEVIIVRVNVRDMNNIIFSGIEVLNGEGDCERRKLMHHQHINIITDRVQKLTPVNSTGMLLSSPLAECMQYLYDFCGLTKVALGFGNTLCSRVIG